ncbi:ribonuclease HII [Parvularcula dongshanensis]|uniref:Ribonuclease HII n=1 Tax=Parvularcula dongshanensis TaxID=1173995 RepID=A0A840I325_9PROT|nr:ribonuclease HII [Parvularcula dongshanensis]MBB4658614.1 ribonuclease HII [Parvularcula dongshanensis]
MALTFEIEDALLGPVAGVDEVGRGPWAGPVVAGAVILDRARVPKGLRDSKKLSAKRREALSAEIAETAAIGLGWVSVAEIDAMGVGKATLLAMSRALEALPVRPAAVIVDGLVLPALPEGVVARALPRADDLSPSVAAASILAKVARDAEMARLHEHHTPYDWASNKGYGTRAHADALEIHGVTPHHRLSFAPIARRAERKP